MIDIDRAFDDAIKELDGKEFDYTPNVDEIIDEKLMQEREKELLESTFKIVEQDGCSIKFQSIEDETLFLQIDAKSMASYREREKQ